MSYLGEILSFQLIRLQDSFVTCISWWNDWITMILCKKRDSQKRKKISTKFFIGCGAQRLLKSCNVTENNIAWKIKWKEETFHAFCIHNFSQQVLMSNLIAVFVDQLEFARIIASLSLHVGRCSDEETVKETGWNRYKMKIS